MATVLNLAAMPAEILEEIFELTCLDLLDLNLLAVCWKIRATLLPHRIVRFLNAFCLDSPSERQQEQIVQLPWCTRAFIMDCYVAWLKHSIRTTWSAYLQRDGLCFATDVSGRLQRKFQGLDDSAAEDEAVEISLEDNDHRISWTTMTIRPSHGTISVRDRLMNQTHQILVPLLQQVDGAKRRAAGEIIATCRPQDDSLANGKAPFLARGIA